jgi:hypothetical protein
MPEAARLDMLAKTAAALPVGGSASARISRGRYSFMANGFATGSWSIRWRRIGDLIHGRDE